MSKQKVIYQQRYTGLMLKSLKFDTVMEDEAQKSLTAYINQHGLDLADYNVLVTYTLVPDHDE